MPKHPGFSEAELRAISETLGHTDDGLSNSEIAKYLRLAQVEDIPAAPEGFYNKITKRDRIFNTLGKAQNEAKDGGPVARFIKAAMKPIHYNGKEDLFEFRRERLNATLSFCGLNLGKDGLLYTIPAAKTLSEAEKRAKGLKAGLESRNVHPDVLIFCRSELLSENYFHAVLETSKSLLHKIRTKTGLSDDGVQLLEKVFENGQRGYPLIAFNKMLNDSQKSEHKGLTQLLRGVVAAFRNPTAHEAKVLWEIDEQEALDIMSLSSLLHRRIDQALYNGVYGND